MKIGELLPLLEGRIKKHGESRIDVQNTSEKICAERIEEADALEIKIDEELQNSSSLESKRILDIIERITKIMIIV